MAGSKALDVLPKEVLNLEYGELGAKHVNIVAVTRFDAVVVQPRGHQAHQDLLEAELEVRLGARVAVGVGQCTTGA